MRTSATPIPGIAIPGAAIPVTPTRRASLLLALAAPAALAALASCHRAPPSGAMQFPPPQVSVMAVAPRDIPLDFTYLGRTEGSREVEVRARVGGFLDSRHFVEGAMVEAGALLFQIDPKPLQAQAHAAAAEVAVARARCEQTAREQKRLEGLAADDAVSTRDRDDAVSAATIADAQLAAAESRQQQVELDLAYTRVTAPIAGKIGQALQPEGSLVGPDRLLTTLLQLDPLYVAFHRSDRQQYAFDADVASGRLALPANGRLAVEVQQRDGTVLATGGTIDYVAGRLDESTGTIPMRATLANPDQRLRAGQAVKVVLKGAMLRGALAVPQRAVVESPQGKAVLLAITKADGSTVFESRAIEVGEWVDLPEQGIAAKSWVVKSGVAAGDRVILDNLVRLSHMPPGMPIEVVAAPAAAPSATTGAPAVGPANKDH